MAEKLLRFRDGVVMFDTPVRVDLAYVKQQDLEAKASRQASAVNALGLADQMTNRLARSIQVQKETEARIMAEHMRKIIAPVRWENPDGAQYVQRLAHQRRTAEDLDDLKTFIHSRMQERRARKKGVDYIRHHLYQQLYDEMIRLVCLDQPETAHVLVRVRDDIRSTVEAYKTLSRSLVGFTCRKTLKCKEEEANAEAQLMAWKKKQTDLDMQLDILKKKCDEEEKLLTELKKNEEKNHREVLEFHKNVNKNLTTKLSLETQIRDQREKAKAESKK